MTGECATALILSLLRHTRNLKEIQFERLEVITRELTSLAAYNWQQTKAHHFAAIAIHASAARMLSFVLQSVLLKPKAQKFPKVSKPTWRILPRHETSSPTSSTHMTTCKDTTTFKHTTPSKDTPVSLLALIATPRHLAALPPDDLKWDEIAAHEIPPALSIIFNVYEALRMTYHVVKKNESILWALGKRLQRIKSDLKKSMIDVSNQEIDPLQIKDARAGVTLFCWTAKSLVTLRDCTYKAPGCEPPDEVIESLEYVTRRMLRWHEAPVNPFILQGAVLAITVSIRCLDRLVALSQFGRRAKWCKGKLEQYKECCETMGV